MKSRSSPQITHLPHSIEAECAVIGAFLATPTLVLDFIDKIRPEFFFVESHRFVIEAIAELSGEGIPPDIVAVYERLRFKNHSAQVGEFAGLQSFYDFATNQDNLAYWVQQVKHYWELRIVVEKCQDLATRGRRVAGAKVEAFLQEAEEVFSQLAEARVVKGLAPASDVVKETLLSLEELMDNPGSISGVPSGFEDLDKITSGFQPSDLIILAARPAMGKTALALNFATHAALKGGKYVAFFSLEMSNKQLMQRLLSTESQIHSHKFRNGKLSTEELNRLYLAVSQFQTDRLMFDDTPGVSILDLTSRCRRMKREKGALDLVIVDYLQLMSAGSLVKGVSNREREISVISMGLKALAKELGCAVIALSQLNRGLEQRPDKRPRPSDLRESGSIEQDADQILFVYRDEVYHKESPDKGIAEIIIGKNRHGSMDTVKLKFQLEFTAFFNIAKNY